MIRALTGAAFVLALASFSAPSVRGNAVRRSIDAPRRMTTGFTYTATIKPAPAAAGLDLWIPIPSDNALQTVSDIRVDVPAAYRITREPKYGNRMVYVHLDHPTGPVSASVHMTVDRQEAHTLPSDPNAPVMSRNRKVLASYLKPDSRVPLGGRYGAIAKEVAAGRTTASDKVRAIYDHVVATMQYDYKKESPKYAEGDVAFVCDYKKGNCSDLHSYLISLARSLGVPAYIEYGFPLTGIPVPNPVPSEGSIAGYHCWTWFHDSARGWVPLDASDARRWLDAKQADVKDDLFGNLVLERSAVAISRGRDITLVPAQKGPPLNDFIYPYAEADGKPIKVGWEVKYRLVSPPTSPFKAAERPAAAGD